MFSVRVHLFSAALLSTNRSKYLFQNSAKTSQASGKLGTVNNTQPGIDLISKAAH